MRSVARSESGLLTDYGNTRGSDALDGQPEVVKRCFGVPGGVLDRQPRHAGRRSLRDVGGDALRLHRL